MQSNDKPTQEQINARLAGMGITRLSQPPSVSQTAQPPVLRDEVTPIDHDRRFDIASPRTVKLFSAMASLYGTLWTREYSESPSPHFDAFASGLDNDRINRVLRRAREKFDKGDKWTPALGELIAWADQPTDGELYDIRARVFARQPANDLERWIVTKCLYNLRRLPERQVAGELKAFYAQAVRLDRMGELFKDDAEVLALPSVSTVNLNDKIREHHKPSVDVSRAIRARIRKLKRAQAAQPLAID